MRAVLTRGVLRRAEISLEPRERPREYDFEVRRAGKRSGVRQVLQRALNFRDETRGCAHSWSRIRDQHEGHGRRGPARRRPA